MRTFNRLFRKPINKAEVNNKPSLTMPGMDEDLATLLANHAIDPLQDSFDAYFGENSEADELLKLDTLDKLKLAAEIRNDLNTKFEHLKKERDQQTKKQNKQKRDAVVSETNSIQEENSTADD